MLDLKQLTTDVCQIATEVGHFLKEERKNFRRERVEEKHAHDYVSYVDKESEVRVVKALAALLPEAGFITEEGSATYQDEPYCWVIDPLDGTTNYILTKMAKEGSDFDVVLKEAQELGYAEKDPTADVEGYDACRKIAILTSLAYGKQVNYEEVYTEGITKITAEDFKYAEKLEAAIKIFGSSRKEGGKLYAMVAPQMIRRDNPLFAVEGVFNAICVTGNMLGDVMFYGKGAGKEATASAVVSDVVDAVKHMNINVMTIWEDEKMIVEPMEEMENRFFVRIGKEEKEKVEKLFDEPEFVDAGLEGEIGFVTEKITEGRFAEALKELSTVITRIRVDF